MLEQKDKIGGRMVAQSSSCGFRKLINDGGLIDMGFKGVAFTWNNKRSGKANIQERLDRGLINAEWRLLFPSAYISHLTALNSDHRPLLLDTNPTTNPLWRPFRFETMWTRDPTVALVISKAWNQITNGNPLDSLANKLLNTRKALKSWNKSSFGHVQSQVKQLSSHIESLQNLPPTPSNLSREANAQLDLDELLKREELHWRDKSREN